jgi:hypothetical protein
MFFRKEGPYLKGHSVKFFFATGPWQSSEFVKEERESLDVECSRSSVITGSACLSVAKVPPDCAAHISPSLGGHPVTASRGEAFSWEESKRAREGERTLYHETITHKRMWPRTKQSVVQLQPGAYSLYSACRRCINGRKHFASSRQMFAPCKTHVPKLLAGTSVRVY